MPYTVTWSNGGFNHREFDTYLRLLRKHGIDWTQAPRVAESERQDRWLYLWQEEEEARAFCEEIRQETRDKDWSVRELEDSTAISQGPLMPVIIQMRHQSLGQTFDLHPHSSSAIRRRFPQARQASNLSIEYGRDLNIEETYGPIWDYIAIMLSGLSHEQLADLGGYQIVDLKTDSVVHESVPLSVG